MSQTFENICSTCKNDCKQEDFVKLVSCKYYAPIDDKPKDKKKNKKTTKKVKE
jgi:hypothetical protein